MTLDGSKSRAVEHVRALTFLAKVRGLAEVRRELSGRVSAQPHHLANLTVHIQCIGPRCEAKAPENSIRPLRAIGAYS